MWGSRKATQSNEIVININKYDNDLWIKHMWEMLNQDMQGIEQFRQIIAAGSMIRPKKMFVCHFPTENFGE